MVNLRERQILAIREMLNLNIKESSTSSGSIISGSNKNSGINSGGNEPIWKLLVYDRAGQDVLTPLMSVQELRAAGVTLHVLLHSERENIPDVPAIYFCLPTEENVERIARDVQNLLYDMYYLNFITPIPRSRIEDLATASWQANAPTVIQKVYDQYLNFISLESDFFVLKQHHNADNISFYAMNRASVQDTEMEAILDTIVDSLFAVFATLGVVPIIRCSRGNAAEHVGEKLDKKIRDNLGDPRNSLFMNDPMSAGQYRLQRPLLILFDRTLDLSTPMHHTWTYQALAHDVLDLKLNQLIYNDSDGNLPGSSKPKSYDLDESRDFFWGNYRGTPFPTTAEAIQTELEDYKRAEDDVKRLKGEMGLDMSSDNITEIGSDMLNDNTARLTSAISNLPQLLEKKRILDAHTGIATAILKQIKNRKLDSFFEYESKLINRTTLDRGVLDILLDPELGDPEDKMRFFLIYYLQQDMSKSELEQFTSALQSSGCDLNPIDFVKKWISYTKMSSQFQLNTTVTSTNKSMLSKLVTHSNFLMEGVRNLVVKRQTLPLTRMTEELMDGGRSSTSEDFRYFDPKILKSSSSQSLQSKSQASSTMGGNSNAGYNEAFVFVIGGGNYIEYQNLQDFVKSRSQATGGNSTKRITYGCTTLCNASQFLRQLSKLGEEMK